MNFRNKLILFIVPPVILMMSGISFYLYYKSSNALLSTKKDEMQKQVEMARSEVERWVTERQDELLLVSKVKAIRDAASGDENHEAQVQLSNLHDISKVYDSILVLDMKGSILINSVKGRSIGMKLGMKKGFKSPIFNALQGEIGIGDVQKSPATGAPVCFVAVPILRDDKVIGVLGGTINLNQVVKLFIDGVKFGESGYPFVVDKTGMMIAHPNHALILNEDISTKDWGKKILGSVKGSVNYKWNGVDKLLIFEQSKTLGWTFSASGTVEEFYEEVAALKYVALIITVVSCLIIVAVLFIITSSIFKTIKDVSNSITHGSQEILMASNVLSDSSQTLSSSTNQQASSVEETSSALEEITNMTGSNLSNAKKLAMLAKEMSNGTSAAFEHVEDLEGAMKLLQESNSEVKELVTIIKKISDKTEIIGEIVFQTKLLSFNASVEAERAGEHGRGFAVVAQEVGNLAQMSGKAAQEISEILEESIQRATDTTAKNENNVVEGVKFVSNIKKVITEIDESSHAVSDRSSEISTSSEEQHIGLKQISEAVISFDQSIQENATVSEESASASEELNQQAVSLTSVIKNLQVIAFGKNYSQDEEKKQVRRKQEKVEEIESPIISLVSSDGEEGWASI